MKINKLEVENFRNFDSLNLSFKDVNIIYGENAQGKTNLIEAIYLFSGAKSFRYVSDNEMIKFGKDYFKIKAEFENSIRQQTAQIIVNKKKEIMLNGVKKSSIDLGQEFKTVIFSPIHLSMIKDGPLQRRKFVDSALYQIKSGYKSLMQEYNRCLKQRNTVLGDINISSNLYDMLDIWDTYVAKSAAKITYQRKKYIESLFPEVQRVFDGISSGKENIFLSLSSDYDSSGDIKDIENAIVNKLKEKRYDDVKNRATSIGPHRDDIEIKINDVSARKYASQGQQRSAVLALKLAEAGLLSKMTGEEPIVLLDDVMSELDENRQDYILNNMKNRQIFITCCDANTVLRLKEGNTIHMLYGTAR